MSLDFAEIPQMNQPPRSAASGSSRFEIVPSVTLKSLGENEGGVLLKLDSGEMYTVNDTTAAFLDAMDGQATVSEIASRLTDLFDVETAVLETDLVEISSDLMDQDLIRAV